MQQLGQTLNTCHRQNSWQACEMFCEKTRNNKCLWASPRLSSAVDIIHVNAKDVQVFISHARCCGCHGSSGSRSRSSRSGRSGRSCIRGGCICRRHGLVLSVREYAEMWDISHHLFFPSMWHVNLLRGTCHLPTEKANTLEGWNGWKIVIARLQSTIKRLRRN